MSEEPYPLTTNAHAKNITKQLEETNKHLSNIAESLAAIVDAFQGAKEENDELS